MKSAEKLFDLLHDSGASYLTVVPKDEAGQSMGVIVIVKDELAQPFLEHLETFEPKAKGLTADEYGWNEDE